MFDNFFRKSKSATKISVPEKNAGIIPITPEEIDLDKEANLKLINDEFRRAFDFIKKYPKSVSFFGSARTPESSTHYEDAKRLSSKIVKELQYAVLTGGGPGIMQAANEGALQEGGDSIGLTIRLPHEQLTNPFVNDSEEFVYFFTRKTALSFAAEAYIFYPGGFGTFDELFDVLTLVQTNKIPRVPVILVGGEYWSDFMVFLKKNMMSEEKAVSGDDLSLITITNDHDKIIEIIKEAPVKAWWLHYEVLNKIHNKL